MKRSLFGSIVLLFVLSSFLYAQEKLVLINLKDHQGITFLNSMKLPVVHEFRDALLTIVDERAEETIRQRGIEIKTLGEKESLGNFYLLENKGLVGKKVKIKESVKVYTDKDNSILEKPENLAELQEAGYPILKLSVTMNTFFRGINNTKGEIPVVVNPEIKAITESVNVDSLRSYIQSLQDFKTRYYDAPNRKKVAEWIRDKLISFGIVSAKLDSFYCSFYTGDTWQYNVVAELKAENETDKTIVIGAHHDSILSFGKGDRMVNAPGADDNASGVAAVLESARVLMANNYKTEHNIIFSTYAAEEIGLIGSDVLAEKLHNANRNITLMINHDMISYAPSANLSDCSVDINYYANSIEYSNMAMNIVKKYSSIKCVEGDFNSVSSDSFSFYERGTNIVYFSETKFTPYYHTVDDLIKYSNIPYCAEVVKSSVATLLHVDNIPIKVSNLKIYDCGSGSDLFLMWNQNKEKDIKGYKLFRGETSGNYYSGVKDISDTAIVVQYLEEGKKMFFGVAAEDQDGNLSFIQEVSCTPLSIPRSPQELVAYTNSKEIKLKWRNAPELDKRGYNLYRGTRKEGPYLKLNESEIIDSFYVDQNITNGVTYFYKIKTEDDAGNESEPSNLATGMKESRDQGVLVVELTNGKGTNLELSEITSRLDNVLKDFQCNKYILGSLDHYSMNYLGAYNTCLFVINVTKVSTILRDHEAMIKKFLQGGGNIVFWGYYPSKSLEEKASYPYEFSAGEIAYDYFKLAKVEKGFSSKFNLGISENSKFANVRTDTNKCLEMYNYHVPNVEAIYPTSEGEILYTYGTDYDTTSTAGKMKGKPVGIMYNGDDYKTALLSFPPYYMEEDGVRQTLKTLLGDIFGEATPVKENKTDIPENYTLSQNYPNPFNPTTTISFGLPKAANVKLKIYNSLGEEITTLVNENRPAGTHKLTFNASSFASGVYFYQITAGKFVSTKKMLLIK